MAGGRGVTAAVVTPCRAWLLPGRASAEGPAPHRRLGRCASLDRITRRRGAAECVTNRFVLLRFAERITRNPHGACDSTDAGPLSTMLSTTEPGACTQVRCGVDGLEHS